MLFLSSSLNNLASKDQFIKNFMITIYQIKLNPPWLWRKECPISFLFFIMNFSWATKWESPSPILGNHSITIRDEVVIHKIIQLSAVMLWKHSDCFLKPFFVHSKGNQTHNVNWHWYCIFICECAIESIKFRFLAKHRYW